jgi:dephospho-CoA kinase
MVQQVSPFPLLRVGLTGGIGSGKSLVAAWLAEWGATVIDADEIARALTAPGGAAMPAIARAFGGRAQRSEGGLDREWMREQILTVPSMRLRLESILHPLIEGQMAVVVTGGCYIVLVLPLLVESRRWIDLVDRICVVDCDTATQIRRVQARSGLTIATIQRIMEIQAGRDVRLAMAHDVILNDGGTSADLLRARTKVLHHRWCAQAQAAKHN